MVRLRTLLKLNAKFSITHNKKMWRLSRIAKLATHSANNDNASKLQAIKDKLQSELEELQGTLQYIKALEHRNEAQLGSFVDAEAQWQAQDEIDRILLGQKSIIEKRIEEIDGLLKTLASMA